MLSPAFPRAVPVGDSGHSCGPASPSNPMHLALPRPGMSVLLVAVEEPSSHPKVAFKGWGFKRRGTPAA